MSIWETFKKVVIVSLSDQISHPDEFRIALENYWGNGIAVELLLVEIVNPKKGVELEEFEHVIRLYPADFGFFAKNKNVQFLNFSKQKRDAIIICGDFSTKTNKEIKKLNSGIKIGINHADNQYEINLQMKSNELLEMVNFAHSIVSKINQI